MLPKECVKEFVWPQKLDWLAYTVFTLFCTHMPLLVPLSLLFFTKIKKNFTFIVSDFCLECEAGTQCPNQGMNDTMPCPAGFYCLNGTVNDGIACPIGKFVL